MHALLGGRCREAMKATGSDLSVAFCVLHGSAGLTCKTGCANRILGTGTLLRRHYAGCNGPDS